MLNKKEVKECMFVLKAYFLNKNVITLETQCSTANKRSFLDTKRIIMFHIYFQEVFWTPIAAFLL